MHVRNWGRWISLLVIASTTAAAVVSCGGGAGSGGGGGDGGGGGGDEGGLVDQSSGNDSQSLFQDSSTTCTPKTCQELNANCGILPDGCQGTGTVNCGTCAP